ncbi:MAG TPA: hypothetical protein VE398_16290, partial [Acidobacteriota bacterium]|nr:hypothetical protein [Acidobacteriota bacterium]
GDFPVLAWKWQYLDRARLECQEASTMSIPNRMDRAMERAAAGPSGLRRGLCIACRKDPACTYPRDASRPVLQCEEFEGYEPRAKGSEGGVECGIGRPGVDPLSVEERGLCCTCANRNSCAFPKPAGGIWHCEEFR